MKLFIPSMECLHVYSSDHLIVKCKIEDVISSAAIKKIINWKYNRPPDEMRSNEIAEYVYTKKQEVDWMFYMIYDKGILQVIDGIHRFRAVQIVKTETSKPLDYLTPSIFGSDRADWLLEKYILISVRQNMTDGQAIDLFQSLNKSNPVPELYMFNTDQQRRSIIEENVQEWSSRFNMHFTASKSPNIPNMNRDRFIEILDFVYTKYNIDNSTRHLLTEKLYELNTVLKNNPPKTATKNAIEKCNKTGCFIFLLRREQLQDSI